MKVAIIGAGFVGLTTACVLASRGINVTIQDTDQEKLSSILDGKVPFFEPGLEMLLKEVLEIGRLKVNDRKSLPDLTVIAVGTPSRNDGSIDTSQVELAIEECSLYLPGGALVAIKSTVIPGTTRRIQNQLNVSNLELLMIPEFLREGSAVSDAITPDRNIIGARNHGVAISAANALGIVEEDCIITTTFSAESIKYLSNAFLATCISFTNEVFASINEDDEFEVNSVVNGWHSDRRFLPNKSGIAGLTSYLIPGPGFGGSCFPKDIRALRTSMNASGKDSSIIEAVIKTNQKSLNDTGNWICSHIQDNEKYLILGIGFKENTDDVRESPAISLAKNILSKNVNGYWYDLHVKNLDNLEGLKHISEIEGQEVNHIILMNHESEYRDFLRERFLSKKSPTANVYAVRYQEPISGMNWIIPRSKPELQINNNSESDRKS